MTDEVRRLHGLSVDDRLRDRGYPLDEAVDLDARRRLSTVEGILHQLIDTVTRHPVTVDVAVRGHARSIIAALFGGAP